MYLPPRWTDWPGARPPLSGSCAAITGDSSRPWWAPTDRGADVVLLNTSFAGPALAEVTSREGVEIIVYDEGNSRSPSRLARADNPNLTTVLA